MLDDTDVLTRTLPAESVEVTGTPSTDLLSELRFVSIEVEPDALMGSEVLIRMLPAEFVVVMGTPTTVLETEIAPDLEASDMLPRNEVLITVLPAESVVVIGTPIAAPV